MTENPDRGLQLNEMIAALRWELQEAQRKAAGENLRFGISGIEVEATVQVTTEGGGRAGVRFWVIEATGDFKHGRSSTQRIKLDLTVPPHYQISDNDGGD
ncbi:trypco2 family protein [Streptomyces sp. NPDC060035]|uniref:trypco2 family protein n=1 Tax=Streptomyces sp. NPDC060035 TaxID=3347044 RepID=UPI0036BFF347